MTIGPPSAAGGGTPPSRPALPAAVDTDRVVVVLRATTSDHVEETVDTLVESGLRCIEVTFTLPDAPGIIRGLVRRYGPDACVGAGTVRTAEQCADAVEAGATFVVSPTFDSVVLDAATAGTVPYLPGAMTPTEIAQAWAAGASAVKVFPAGLLGPRFLAAVREPMPEPPLVPSGAIDVPDIRGYLRAGARAVSLGGALVGDALRGGSQEELRGRALLVGEQLTAGAVQGG